MVGLVATEKDPATRLAAVRLAGAWRLESAIAPLAGLARGKEADPALRLAAFSALASVGKPAKAAIQVSVHGDDAPGTRILATAALARIDATAAADAAVGLMKVIDKGHDLTPIMAAFLDRRDGPEILARAVERTKLPADNAKLALRAVYTLGRADASLVAALSKAAGIGNETKPPTKEEMDKLVADVASKGNPERGERIFRRPDLSCIKCHAIAGAGGGVGPDLSSVGLSAPVDYVINSILLPDQAIKEQYHTLVIATNDGQVYHGIVTDKDESKVVLKQATGDLKTVPTSEIDESKEGGSLMPKGLANLMTRDEFLDLVKFISELGKPGPYAIHATPTIQRWRLMAPVPEEMARAVPDPGTFVARIRDSDPSLWIPAYGLSTGEVPLDEFAKVAGSRTLYLRGEVEVSAAGAIEIDLGCHHGVLAWPDDAKDWTPGRSFTWQATPGKHTITIRVDTTDRKLTSAVVKLAKPRRDRPSSSSSSEADDRLIRLRFNSGREAYSGQTTDRKRSMPQSFALCVFSPLKRRD